MDYVIVDVICVNMPVLTSEDKALIKVLRVEKGWNVDRMMSEFPAREWKRRTTTLYDLVRKIDQTAFCAHCHEVTNNTNISGNFAKNI